MNHPLIGELDRDGWSAQGMVEWSFWSDFENECEPSQKREPGQIVISIRLEEDNDISPAQDQAIRYLFDNPAVFEQKLIETIFDYYKHNVEGGIDIYSDSEEERIAWIQAHVPVIEAKEELQRLIRHSAIFVHKNDKDGIAFVGFAFDCSWDDEHGAGVLMHRDSVLAVGHDDKAFDEAVSSKFAKG
ncbi:MAG: hypothetical protein FD138_1257 [Planctomycetota bacterium]|nr:MAG: hypothetical protein FD138_1257 [Planctomycetota bacterium]